MTDHLTKAALDPATQNGAILAGGAVCTQAALDHDAGASPMIK
jgi:hypothetical protein